MRSSKSRSRNKSNRQRSIGNIINRVFDSSGPEGKVRGTPQQIIEKYLALARDAQLSNDRVAEQNFLQHAEHYTRMLGEAQRELAREQEERNRNYQQNGNQNGGNAQQGGQNNNFRDRPEREPREPQPEPVRFEEAPQPRYEGAPVLMPDFFAAAEDDGPGLVETPEMRQPEPPRPEKRSPAPRPVEASAAAPAEETAATETAPAPAKSEGAPKPRSRAPRKPRSDKPKADRAAEAPPEGSAAE
ncbi:DUF4167 domain-containing protein [Rhodobacter capsulatus]|uniref:DUF4167 domain-containing protein n=1 Tax=Rhodobacter capsulatus TaxID=1061 RepID=A0A4U1K2Y2_RHOCA|nr:DUF4167 domain-containing protein [Rhodobacter capsulatus]TKD26391.1 DUF4167 domain-containing protein [Rhodobacter capsulatus]